MDAIKYATIALLVGAVVMFIWACAAKKKEAASPKLTPATGLAEPSQEFKSTDAEKSLALCFVIDEIKYCGGPDVAADDARWEVYPAPEDYGYYVVLKPKAIWFVDAKDNFKVAATNKVAYKIAPGVSYNTTGRIRTYDDLISRYK